MNVIETHALTKIYGRGRRAKRAVDALDMHVAQGEIYGFVGKNGAGKSTAMKIIAGLASPTSGEVSLFGGLDGNLDATRDRDRSFSAEPSRIGALIEEPGILTGHSAYDNLMCKALALGVVRAKEQCRDLLQLVGLEDTGRKKAKGFSLGMKQRLGLALALVGSPDLLLLDEPLNGLDPEATRAMRNTLVRLNQERGVTILISSHVLDQLNRLATCYGVIRAGSMVREFSEAELHAECSSSIRVKTADPARTLALLEERLPGATFRAEPDQSILVSSTAGGRSASANFGGAAGSPAASGAPTVEDVSRILHDTDQIVLELSVQERDIEDYFVELMGGKDADEEPAAAKGGGPR